MQTSAQVQPETKGEIKAQTVAKIVSAINGKNVEARRVAALEEAGFMVSYEGVKWDFGRACTAKPKKDGSVLVQIKYATSAKCKDGHLHNRCEIYRVR